MMSYQDSEQAWTRFASDIHDLAGELKRHYRKEADETSSAEVDRSLRELGRSADAVFKSLETATRDPEVRLKTKDAARSFGMAWAETFRDLSDEIEKALRKPAENKS
jgi:hypothetical protein